MGIYVLEYLKTWCEKYQIVGEIRGRGLMIAMELVENKQTCKSVSLLRNRIIQLAFQHGLLLLACGESSIRICPSLLIDQDEMTIGLRILEDCIQVVAKNLEEQS
jgi:4-aminobutyrate aminotransferase